MSEDFYCFIFIWSEFPKALIFKVCDFVDCTVTNSYYKTSIAIKCCHLLTIDRLYLLSYPLMTSFTGIKHYKLVGVVNGFCIQ